MSRQVIVANSSEEFVDRSARVIADTAREAIAKRGLFTIALSGGSTVRAPYEQLAAASGIDWSRVLIFFGDDRFVDLDNPYSNYAQAKEALIDRVPIPSENVFPLPVKATNPTQGAAEYERTIREKLGVREPDIPVFDLIHLGMGPDGHTASLFPHTSALSDKRAKGIVRMNHAGLAPWVDRLTFSYALINNARRILITATGQNKSARLKQVLEDPATDFKHVPIAGIAPKSEDLIWLLDRPAAADLTPSTITG